MALHLSSASNQNIPDKVSSLYELLSGYQVYVHRCTKAVWGLTWVMGLGKNKMSSSTATPWM